MIQFVHELSDPTLLDDFLADDLEKSVTDPSECPAFLLDNHVSTTEAWELKAHVNNFAKDCYGSTRAGSQQGFWWIWSLLRPGLRDTLGVDTLTPVVL
jgi:hypothetical protein